MAKVINLPEGFVLDEPQTSELPPGFVLDRPASKPSKTTSVLKAFFTPAEVVRQGVGRQVTQDIRRGKEMIEATPVGQFLKVGLAPPLRVFIDRLPEDIGETVGTAASTLVDPTTALFGFGGTVRNRLLRAGAGLATGTVGGVGRTLAGTEAPDPSQAILNAMIGGTAGGIGAAATRVTPRGIRIAPPRDLSPVEQAKIQAAQQSARTLGSPTGQLFGRRGIIGTARERLERVRQLKTQQLEQRMARTTVPLKVEQQQAMEAARAAEATQQEALTVRRGHLQERFTRSLNQAATRQQQNLDAARARTSTAIQHLDEAEQFSLTRLTTQQKDLEGQLNSLGWDKVQAVRQKFLTIAINSSKAFGRLVEKGIRKVGNRPIGRQEYLDELSQRFQNDPQRVQGLVDQVFGEAEAVQAKAAYASMRQFSEGISRTAKQGRRVYTSTELFYDHAIDVLVTLMERRGATQFRAARTSWAQWAPLRDRVMRDFKPFVQDPMEIDAMTNRLLSAAQESRPRFVERLETEFNIPIFPELKAVLSQLDDVQAQRVVLKLRTDILREQSSLTGQREVTDVTRVFGLRKGQLGGRQARAETVLTHLQREAEVTRQRAETDIGTQFGLKQESLKTQHDARLAQLRDNFEAWAQDISFQQRFGAAGAVGIAGMLLYWNLIANAVRAVAPEQRFENF